MSDKLCDKEDCLNYFYKKEEETEAIENKQIEENFPYYYPNICTGTSNPSGIIQAMTASPYSSYTVYGTATSTISTQPLWAVNNSPINIESSGKLTINLPCFSELGINGLPIECLMCSHLKKMNMNEVLVVYKAKEELKK